MAAVWGISTWIWVALGLIFCAGAVLIARVLLASFRALGELKESIELSGRLISSALETAREEAGKAQQAVARLGKREAEMKVPGSDEDAAWRDW